MPRIKPNDTIAQLCHEGLHFVISQLGSQAKLAQYLVEFNPKIKPPHISFWVKSGYIPAEYIMFLHTKSKGLFNASKIRPDLYPTQLMMQARNPIPSSAIRNLFN